LPRRPRCILLAATATSFPNGLAADWELVITGDDPAPIGKLMLLASALVLASELDDPTMVTQAQHVMLPCFAADDEDLTTELTALLTDSPLATLQRSPVAR
jgi:hypothetical protein